MNTTYMRQNTLNADQMHSFFKDKQAWENAIAMYQGPDPLDHWYNYICWYENHGHGDPENKYRETLERCLTIFEHSDYYKQDLRMVRLWLKYIDMQPNPLHFYQVLYQRGTGRQVAVFYMGWANYYETARAFKEAESVYSLGFQEKAQPYAELHLAHSKFMYGRTVATNIAAQQQQQQQQQPTQEKQQQQQVHYQQQQQPLSHQHQAHAPQQTYAQQQSHISQNYRQQHTQQIYQQQQQQLQMSQQEHYPQIPQQSYNPPQAHLHQQQQNINEQQQPQQQHNFTHQLQTHYQHIMPSEQPIQPPSQQPQLSATEKAQEAVQIKQRALQNGADDEQAEPLRVGDPSDCIEGIRLPRNFATYARNINETWKPALTLEEPDDPYRQCHYPKQLVYPAGAGIEYCPEELLARKFDALLEHKRRQRMTIAQQQEQNQQATNVESAWVKLEETTPQRENLYNSYEEQTQQQEALLQTTVSELERINNDNRNNSSYNEEEAVAGEYEVDGDDNDECAREENDEQDEEDVEEEDDEEDVPLQQLQHQQPFSTSYCDDQIEASTIRFSMQTEEKGIQNKTIKIKFKKERTSGNDSVNGSEYSAYTIENIYQPETPASPQMDNTRMRNGHSFHPYMLAQTSTPKTNSSNHHHAMNGSFQSSSSNSSRRSKSKLKRIQHKFQATVCSNSNSSSAEPNEQSLAAVADVARGGECQPAMALASHTLHNATFNDNANYSFSSATALDNSNCSITTAVGRLNFRETSVASNNNNNNSTVVADFSTFQENSYFATQHDIEAKERRLAKALETIDRHMAKEAIDPFNSELCRAFLTKLDFPGEDDAHANYKIIQTPLPKIANTRTLSLPDGVQFSIDKEVGRGSYGSVYKATHLRTGKVVALKYQKPPNSWEIYICDQVLKRIQERSVLPGLMDISTAIIAPNASLIATEFSPYGSLLDINNKIRQATTKVMHESLVMHFSAQICNIIHHLHMRKIIHADIKPDNFLLMRLPGTELGIPSLRLIDFGCAIDMTLFPNPDETKFRKVIQTDGFTCIEMQEGRPWSYETDLFCIAGTVHVMLFGEYMQLQKRAGTWDIRQKLPRYLKKHVWGKFFGDLLNINGGELPDLHKMRNVFEEEADRMESELQKQIRSLSNILRRR